MKEQLERHPNLATWLALAVGMLVVLAWSARDVALAPVQWLWLAVATILLAGLCAWIISWEADAPDEWAEDGDDADTAGTADDADTADTADDADTADTADAANAAGAADAANAAGATEPERALSPTPDPSA